ncbi:MAG: fused MFS/spermidine synthase [Hyphomicrobium sp.]|nr:fused MFS/spermidine synthase [Hyphomicrobium sp.]
MYATLTGASFAGRLATVRGQAAVLAIFTATLFLSALLLFSVQPMFAKMVLPQLGGSPSVWAVSTCFFQAVLLAGYCYAHVLNRFVEPRLAPLVHLAVLTLAYLAMPIGLPAGASEPPADGAYLWLIGILAAGVGLPFFAVSANAPLLQAWFSRTGNPHANDPYFLYGASNLGSLLALLSYPVVIEPVLGLGEQSNVWTFGFLLLVTTIAVSGVIMVALGRETPVAVQAAPESVVEDAAPSVLQRARWVLFAAIPSGLLVAFTTHLSTDIAAAPFLWVVPLAMFLLTFVLVFRDKPVIQHGILVRIQPLLVSVTILSLIATMFDWWQSSLVAFSSFLVTTLVAHRALYEDRPAASYLTAFYLWMSLGGALGGIFAAIIAPQIFNATYEFPLLLTLGMLCRPGVFSDLDETEKRMLGIGALMSVCALGFGFMIQYTQSDQQAMMVGVYTIAVGSVFLIAYSQYAKLQILIIGALAAVAMFLPSSLNRGEPSRSFFGVIRVLESENGDVRRLLHGTTSHGAQRLKDANGKVIMPPVPATYYHPASPMAMAVGVARNASGKPSSQFRGGIIGLGVGSMACYAKPEETWRYYEIDAAVVAVAADLKRFNFLSACRPNADIVLGDARLTVAKEQPASFDYLQIDAFSSDSVPTHLLTAEALKLYLSKLTDKGVLAIHVSNRHLDLAPVAAAAAFATPGTSVAIVKSNPKVVSLDSAPSVVVIVTKDPASIAPVKDWQGATMQDAATVTAWTDDYSDIISALWRVYGPKH